MSETYVRDSKQLPGQLELFGVYRLHRGTVYEFAPWNEDEVGCTGDNCWCAKPGVADEDAHL